MIQKTCPSITTTAPEKSGGYYVDIVICFWVMLRTALIYYTRQYLIWRNIMSELISGLDQGVALTPAEVKELATIDEVLEKSITANNPDVALEYGNILRRSGAVTGLALSKLLYGLAERWETFSTDMDFEDAVFTTMGIAPGTTYKYVRIWERLFEAENVPQWAKKGLMGKPMQTLDLLPAAAAADQITDGTWKDIIAAPDRTTVRDIVRELRGGATSSSTAVVLIVDKDDVIKCKKGDGKYYGVGVFNPEGEIGELGRQLIIDRAHILPQKAGKKNVH
jgi:hypothetical protein